MNVTSYPYMEHAPRTGRETHVDSGTSKDRPRDHSKEHTGHGALMDSGM